MITLKESLLSYLKQENYLVENFNFTEIGQKLLTIQKWNLDYGESLKLQKLLKEYVRTDKSKMIYLICNHPHVFTMGRGVQRGKSDKLKELVPFNESIENKLNYKVFKIKRGGGITFHYPGQWIIYPIVNLGHPDYSLSKLVEWVLANVKSVLTDEFNLSNIDTKKSYFGVWKDSYKLGSLGIGIDKFITQHGLALNLVRDELMFKELKKINPCGLTPDTYRCLDDFLDKAESIDLVNRFNISFHKQIENNFEKQ